MIYVMEAVGIGFYKIGKANDPESRRKSLQIGCPVELRIIAFADFPDHGETLLHRRFRHCQSQNEWFKSCPELMKFIATLTPYQSSNESERLNKQKRFSAQSALNFIDKFRNKNLELSTQ